MSEPGLILFDCDGTLVDSHADIVRSMQQAIVMAGHMGPSETEVRSIIGLSMAAALDRLLPGVDAAARELVVGAYRETYVASESAQQLYPGVSQTLKALVDRGYWLGVVTGKSKRGLLRVLEKHDLDSMFLVLRTADCCPSKPHPAMVLESMQEMGVGAENTVVVGDACFDMQMASASQVRGIGVSFGAESAQSLRAAGAEHVVDTFTQLLAYFPPLRKAEGSATL